MRADLTIRAGLALGGCAMYKDARFRPRSGSACPGRLRGSQRNDDGVSAGEDLLYSSNAFGISASSC